MCCCVDLDVENNTVFLCLHVRDCVCFRESILPPTISHSHMQDTDYSSALGRGVKTLK